MLLFKALNTLLLLIFGYFQLSNFILKVLNFLLLTRFYQFYLIVVFFC